MEAIGENSTKLNVAVNFQVKIKESDNPEIIGQKSGLQSGDTVQIYPHTVNLNRVSDIPEEVAGRKIRGDSPYGPFIILPVPNLDLREEHRQALQEFNCKKDKTSYITRIKGSACSELLEQVTELSMGKKVQYYPYTLEVCIEENGSSVSLSPLLIAVRKVKKDIAYGDFHFIGASQLYLNEKQMNEIRGIVLASINDLLKKSQFKEKDIKYLLKNFSKNLNFSEEGVMSYLDE